MKKTTNQTKSRIVNAAWKLFYQYGYEDTTTIINNCDTYVYMGGSDPDTCEDIARRMGTSLPAIMHMPLEREIIFRRGSKPFVTDRCDLMFEYVEDNTAA